MYLSSAIGHYDSTAVQGKRMDRIPAFNPQQLTAVTKVLGDTAKGLTGSEIAYFLSDCKILEVGPEMTNWKRLFNAFVEWQNRKQLGNHILMFINRAMNPVCTRRTGSFSTLGVMN
jgi:hypothetical protein